MSGINIKLESQEVWPLTNVLNEVCHGLRVRDFERTIGASQQTVSSLLDRIMECENDNGIDIDLSELEIKIIKLSIIEVFRQIDDWEFKIRVGVQREKIAQIGKKIADSVQN